MLIGPLHRDFGIVLKIWSLAMALKSDDLAPGIDVKYLEINPEFAKIVLKIPDGMITSMQHFKESPIEPGEHKCTFYINPKLVESPFMLSTDLPLYDLSVIYGQLFHQLISHHDRLSKVPH